MRIAAAVCLVLALAATPASAAPFQVVYAPHIGQHADVRIRRCQDPNESNDLSARTCTTIVYDEEVVAPAGDGFRIRYTVRSVDGPNAAAALAQLRATPLDLITNANGAPIAFADRQGFFQNLRQSLPQDDPAALDAAMAAYQRLDNQAAVSAFTKDISALSVFQALPAMNVGEPESHGVSTPFPPQPSQIVDGTRTFQLDAVDARAGVARAHFTTDYDADSLTRAVSAISPQSNIGRLPSNAKVTLTEQTDALIDVASGETRHLHSVRTMLITQSLSQLVGIRDTVDVDRHVISR